MQASPQTQFHLENTILTALAKLDERGDDQTVTRAMSIVYLGFQHYNSGGEFSPDAIFAESATATQLVAME